MQFAMDGMVWRTGTVGVEHGRLPNKAFAWVFAARWLAAACDATRDMQDPGERTLLQSTMSFHKL
jgi:hypothetical protein